MFSKRFRFRLKSFISKFVFIIPISTLTFIPHDNRITKKYDNFLQFKKKKELVVLTLNSATTYYVDKYDRPSGPEYSLMKSFAKYIDMRVRYIVLNNVKEVLDALYQKKGDIAAAGITRIKSREVFFQFGPSYQNIEQYVVCNKKFKVIKITDLVGKNILVVKDSSFQATLENLKIKNPNITFETTVEFSTENILESVWKGKVDCTVCDSNIFNMTLRYLPLLKKSLTVDRKNQLAWAVLRENQFLVDKMDDWFKEFRKRGNDRNWYERFYGYTKNFDYYDVSAYMKNIKKRLPKYKNYFEQAAKKYDLPWKLLAAISYQESHWNPKAKSPTGVRGLMMLTQSTAKALGVKNRLDPKQSIWGGTKHFKEMIRRVPSFIKDKDRFFMGLAAYNVGYYHLRDAMVLAVLLEKNPNKWVSIKEVLPLLSNRKYYKKLQYGYARGREPVVYVERIRNYYEILKNIKV